MDQLTVIVGGQAGSEGKGAVTARLHREEHYDWAVRVGGPNAGHTVIADDGRAYPLRQLPVAAVADPNTELVIAAGSEVDEDVLVREIEEIEREQGVGVSNRLRVDVTATRLMYRHQVAERDIRHGTTGKGIGAARAERAMRQARLWGQGDDTQTSLRRALARGERVMIEGTQGYVLGSHAGHYPHCTSGDCRASDFLAAAGLAPQAAGVWVVLRTYPIRIAGNSGPLPKETSWDELGLTPEYTTVTKKVRRVAEWNWDWAAASVEANSAPDQRPTVALTFADYWWNNIAGVDGWRSKGSLTEEIRKGVEEIEDRLDVRVGMLGTGPSTQIMIEKE